MSDANGAWWYKDAVIYEVHVRAFADSNGDGIGDFRGLTAKLDYLQDLGVTAVWLLPFYPSPLRDGGYDIADYTGVHPDYGTSQDFAAFLAAAHERDIKVITELVINHTSTAHPWFERARRAPPGSPEREFYVWSDTSERYTEARVIFKDFETSNWAWDPVARGYYWHRFYAHQPDLNYENPAVHDAIMEVLDEWLSIGVDGVRLDAVPYLFEREGTSCENLPETHAFLKKLRARVDAKYPNRMLLAEANQWPADAAAYFGDGDECHMNFHFPLMPRMFMAVNLEDSFPIVDILRQTPAIPPSCQWATFLRNHDELTLEMVTEEDRDSMYRVYARDHRARLNLGIRRRLAPLLGDRRRQEVLTAILFSLPGTPVLYYGDEIGMGDNIYLGDRDGVRTPMQWNADRNAGFSRANPQRLYLPLVVDPAYHYEAINVETQQANPSSLLWWTKHLISLRRQSKVLRRGDLSIIDTGNTKVLAVVREHEGERALFVANLSRFPQHAALLMSAYQGAVPVETLGRSRFPRIEQPHWGISLGPYDYFWFSLESQAVEGRAQGPLRATTTWRQIAEHGGAELALRLAEFIANKRWYRSKGVERTSQALQDVIDIPAESDHFLLALLRIERGTRAPETYVLPLAYASGAAAREIEATNPGAVITTVLVAKDDGSAEEGVLIDALAARGFGERLLKTLASSERIQGIHGELRFDASLSLTTTLAGRPAPAARVADLDQTNSVIFYGSDLVLKLLRVIDEGPNAEEEMSQTITARAPRRLTPPLLGTISWEAPDRERALVGLATEMVANRGTAWTLMSDAIQGYFDSSLAQGEAPPAVPAPLGAALIELPAHVREMMAPLPSLVELLAERTAGLHRALAGRTTDADFAPEPFDVLHQQSLYQSARGLLQRALDLLAQASPGLPVEVRALAAQALAHRDDIDRRLRDVTIGRIDVDRIRCHGDLHLGQVLFTGDDFVFIDFEGEPARPLRERRYKRCPLRDVAGMVRSFDYIADATLTRGRVRQGDVARLTPWAQALSGYLASLYVETWLDRVRGSRLAPRSRVDARRLLRFYLIEKCIYEVRYELTNRPDWLAIPLGGLARLMSSEWQ